MGRSGCTAPGLRRVFREATLGAVAGEYRLVTANDHYNERRNLLEWTSDKVIKVTARVFHSPVLFSVLFLMSLAAVLIAPDREDK